MTLAQLRAKLKTVNLSQLARDSKINVRTLRRVRNVKDGQVLASTLERIERALAKATR